MAFEHLEYTQVCLSALGKMVIMGVTVCSPVLNLLGTTRTVQSHVRDRLCPYAIIQAVTQKRQFYSSLGAAVFSASSVF